MRGFGAAARRGGPGRAGAGRGGNDRASCGWNAIDFGGGPSAGQSRSNVKRRFRAAEPAGPAMDECLGRPVHLGVPRRRNRPETGMVIAIQRSEISNAVGPAHRQEDRTPRSRPGAPAPRSDRIGFGPGRGTGRERRVPEALVPRSHFAPLRIRLARGAPALRGRAPPLRVRPARILDTRAGPRGRECPRQGHFTPPVSGSGAAAASRSASHESHESSSHESSNLHFETDIIRILLRDASGTRAPIQREIAPVPVSPGRCS